MTAIEDKYDVKVSRTNPNGKVNVFEEFDMDIGENNVYVLNFGSGTEKAQCASKTTMIRRQF